MEGGIIKNSFPALMDHDHDIKEKVSVYQNRGDNGGKTNPLLGDDFLTALLSGRIRFSQVLISTQIPLWVAARVSLMQSLYS